MASARIASASAVTAVFKDFLIAAFAAFLALPPANFKAAGAAPADRLSDGDKQCLACRWLLDKNQALVGRGCLPYSVIAR
jgi:hypothetical protein